MSCGYNYLHNVKPYVIFSFSMYNYHVVYWIYIVLLFWPHHFRYHVAWSHDCLEKIEVICANAIPATLEEAESDDDKYQTLAKYINLLHLH